MAYLTKNNNKKHTFAVTVEQKNQRYFLRKEHKLKSRKAIDLLFTKGKSFNNYPFRICWKIVDEKELKAGFTASSKNFKHATDRNRIKRLTREAYRLQKNNLQETIQKRNNGLHIFFIYTGKEISKYEFVFEKMNALLKKILKTIDENNQ